MSSGRSPPRDLAEVARRISSRTIDLLAAAILAAALLSVGVKLTQWWRAAPPDVVGAAAEPAVLAVWDEPSKLDVEFGRGPWSLRRVAVQGDAAAVIEQTARFAKQAAGQAAAAALPPPDAAELEWLQRLQHWPPHEQGPGWSVYALGGPWPWMVGTASVDRASSDEPPGGAPPRRVICWTVAVPEAADQWTLYMVDRRSDSASTARAVSGFHVPLPLEASGSLTVSSETGGITCFRGSAPVHRWREDWHRRLTDSGWATLQDWQLSARAERAVYGRQRGDAAERLSALLLRGEDGATIGLCEWRVITDTIQ